MCKIYIMLSLYKPNPKAESIEREKTIPHHTNLLELLLLYNKPSVTYKDLLSIHDISNISRIASLKVENVIRDLVFVFNILIFI